MRNLVFGFGAGVAVGAGGCYLYLSVVQKPEPRRVGRGGVELDHPALKHGVPETDIIRVYDGYVAAYDYRTRNPKWVAEHITPASWSGEANRERSEFFPDPEVDPRFGAKLSDFRGSGYDRGHMAPAANHKDSQKAMDQTFSLVNISPQAGKGFNRDYWARFERFVKELTDVAGDVYVITGPLWLPTQQQLEGAAAGGAAGSGAANGAPTSKWTLTHDWIGKPPGLVAVPTHYYKVVLADTRGDNNSAAGKQPLRGNKQPLPRGTVGVGAFVMPNAPIDPRTPLAAYVVPLEDLEQVAGTSFFPALLGDSRRREAADVAAAGWRAAGMSQLKPFERLTMKQAFAALPPPASSMTIDVEASTSGTSISSSGSSAAEAPRPPKTPAGSGVVHICEVNACRLPPTDFFQRGSGGGGGGGGAGGGGGGRSSSAPSSRSR
ncbi:hypothetical protein CHLRE_08g362750v5 [Chlamydomonas reinhardtii]|uniref:Endonuclease n=1 Tax=Chlamydomonas reinhardtii TaxID=3055 RepID=A0A2K3DGL6_CHLRE|nr:uncharacterized protein CHLRE_08g362750v5 [Chlamydomonas reinhardtii]PNW79681.1 hypothetical protein CHLRE_08g362750v5 [Chlamydomonas reinhardtii]